MPNKNSSAFVWQTWIAGVLFLASSGLQLQAQTRWDNNDSRNRGYSSASNSELWQGSDWLGGGATQRRTQWRLGVRGDNTDVGVLIREVVPGSAAERARIEVNDVIVNVDGFQVGMVGGRLYELAEEINRRADSTGKVSLVLQDHRNYGLANVRIQLENSQQALKGNLIYRDRNPLPSDAIVTVQVENVSRPYYQVRRGQTAFRAPAGSTIPFEIAYDPTFINPQDTYQVRAFVTLHGRTILDTPQPQPVITKGNSSQVQLQLVPLTSTVSNSTTGNVVTAGYPNYNQINDELIRQYRQYLRRDPTLLELAALRATPGIEEKLKAMPIELMAAQEYFDAAGNNNLVWLEKVFAEIVKRRATQSELEQWMQRYAELRFSRTDLLRQLYSQIR